MKCPNCNLSNWNPYYECQNCGFGKIQDIILKHVDDYINGRLILPYYIKSGNKNLGKFIKHGLDLATNIYITGNNSSKGSHINPANDLTEMVKLACVSGNVTESLNPNNGPALFWKYEFETGKGYYKGNLETFSGLKIVCINATGQVHFYPDALRENSDLNITCRACQQTYNITHLLNISKYKNCSCGHPL
jgi:hypothetical protein